MANDDDLFTTLRRRGLRKSVARAIADAEGAGKAGGAKAEAAARGILEDLDKAGDAIRARVLDGGDGGGTRSRAGQKAAATRKRDAAKRSAAAKRGAATRKSRAKG